MWTLFLVNLYLQSVVLCLDDVTLLDLMTPIAEYGEACGYMSCPQENAEALNVHIVPATHLELGFSRTFHEHYTGEDPVFRTTTMNVNNVLDAVITALWTNKRRKFTLTNLPYFFYWWKNRDSTVRRMVYQLIRQGRLFFAGGGWSESDESVASYHAIIDQYTFGLRKLNATFLGCGRPLVTWQVDNCGHSREYASLMAQMGFDGHFINPISYEDELQRMRSKSLEFVWRGSDDLGAESDIYTHKLFDGYWSPPGFCFGTLCTDPLIITFGRGFTNIEERVKEFRNLVLERQSPYYTTNHIMVMMGDKFGYSDADTWFRNIDKLIAGVNERQCHLKSKLHVFYSTPACYLKAVQKAQPTLLTKQDDFYPLSYDKSTVVTGFFTSRPTVKYMAREIHRLLQMAKQLQLFGRLRNNEKKFEDIHWITGVMHDHSVLAGGMRPRVQEYYAIKVHKAKELCMQIFRPALNILRNASRSTVYYMCPFNESSCRTISSDVSFIVVYNPLAWPVTLPIRLPVYRERYLLRGPNGDPVNHTIMAIPEIVKQMPVRAQRDHEPSLNDEMVFIAEDIPAMGYRSYFLQKITRTKRSIKQLTKTKKKRYLTPQTSNINLDADDPLYDIDYEHFEDVTPKPVEIQVENIFKKEDFLEQDDDYVMTPRPKTAPTLTTTTESTSTTEMETETTEMTETRSSQSTSSRTSPLPSPASSLSPEPDQSESPDNSILESNEYLEDPPSSRMEDSGYMSSGSSDRLIKNQNEDFMEQDDHHVMTPRPKTAPTLRTTTKSTSTTETTEMTETHSSHAPPCRISPLPSPTSSLSPEPDQTESPDNSTLESNEYLEDPPSRRMEDSGYMSSESSDRFIMNQYIILKLNHDYTKITSMVLSNGVKINLEIQMLTYISDDPKKMGTKKYAPGAYVFRPMDPKPKVVSQNPSTKVLKSDLVEEIHIKFAPYAGIAVKLYEGLPYVEVDWVVGPLPMEDHMGREIFIRYATDMVNDGIFYTDSNGRQTIKRVKDARPTYRPVTEDGVASNFYPVSSKVYIEDTAKNVRFSVFPDRGEGCSCLAQGTLDIMLLRRIFTGNTGYKLGVNETEFGKGVIIRGKHMLYLSKADYKPNKVFEKKFAKELELKPKIFTSAYPYDLNVNYSEWNQNINEYTALKNKLPIGVHILTIEKWYNSILIRIENYLEITDVVRNGLKKVFINELFKKLKLFQCRETMLAANIWKDQYIKMLWNKGKFVKRFNDAYGNVSNLEFVEDFLKKYAPVQITKGIELAPQQIRTFVCSYEYLTVI